MMTSARLLAAYWGVTAGGNWEGTNVLHLPGVADAAARADRARPDRAARGARETDATGARRQAAGRLERPGPARAGSRRARPATTTRYAEATRRLIDFVEAQLRARRVTACGGRRASGRAHTPGFCEDYVALADGLLTAHAALGEPGPLLLARRLVEAALRDFWDDDGGTFVDTS